MILAIVFDDFITAEPEFHSITFRGNEDQEAYEFLGLVSSDHKTVMFSSTEENSAMQRIFQSLESSDLLYARTVDYQGRQINIEVPVNGLSEIIKADACMSRNLNIPIAE